MRLRTLARICGILWPMAAAQPQAVRGIVADTDSAAVSGVIVLLIDASGSVVGRALTNDAGEFRVAAEGAGNFWLRTLRIGFRPVISDPIHLESGQEVSRRIVVSGVPFSLDTVRVVGRNYCRLNSDSASATYAIWEQVRAALTAAQVTSRSRAFAVTLVAYDRVTDGGGKRVRREAATLKSGFTTRPWYSVPADSLRRFGYVLFEPTGARTYYAPDLDVLISDIFLDDHCFGLSSSRDPARLGVAFRPTDQRSEIPEIRGTVWLDRKTAELRSLEFEYVNFARGSEEGRAGGEIEFARLKNNAWAISRWNIRMPAVTQRFTEVSGVPGMPAKPQYRVAEIKITGGELVLVSRGTDTLFAGTPLTLAGIVEDSTTGAIVSGAQVQLAGAPIVATADERGRFELTPVLPGEHSLIVRTRALDSIAASHVRPVTFTGASEVHRVRLPSAASVAARMCPSNDDRSRRFGMIVGRLRARDASATPSNVPVAAHWTDLSAQNQPGSTTVIVSKLDRRADATTDSAGVFRLCGVPLNTVVEVRATQKGDVVLSPDLRIPERVGWTRVDGLVDLGSPRPGAVLMGRILTASQQPIASADVSIPSLGSSDRSSTTGTYRISDIPAGSREVTVRQLGYAAQTVTIQFTDGSTVERDFVMASAQVLDSVVVAARPTKLPEFEERRKLGIGHYITRDELAKQENRRMSEVLLQVGGLRIERSTGASAAWVKAGRGQMTTYQPDAYSAAVGAKPACYVDVWLDGVRVYEGARGQPLFDINTLQPAILEGVEYYAGASQTPIKYMRPNLDCGVLVVWTRRG